MSETHLKVPTFTGFVAMKVAAWFDRRTCRDLFDLAALARIGSATGEQRDLVTELVGYSLSTNMLDNHVVGRWHEELAHQTRLEVSEDDCLASVLAWW